MALEKSGTAPGDCRRKDGKKAAAALFRAGWAVHFFGLYRKPQASVAWASARLPVPGCLTVFLASAHGKGYGKRRLLLLSSRFWDCGFLRGNGFGRRLPFPAVWKPCGPVPSHQEREPEFALHFSSVIRAVPEPLLLQTAPAAAAGLAAP